MSVAVTETDRLLSHKDLHPWPIGEDESIQSGAGIYRRALEIFLDTDFLPLGHTFLTDASLQLVDRRMSELLQEPRWINYQTPEMGDMNVGTHTLRQIEISAQALYLDTKSLALDFQARDAFLAAAALHDLGELVVGDITYDEKQASKQAVDMREAKAVLDMIDKAEDINPVTKPMLKEVYLRITTSLANGDIRKLHPERTRFDKVEWNNLRDLFKLYERYSYLITATQQYPLHTDGFTETDMKRLLTWNRPELEQAMAADEELPTGFKEFILFKNVALNQWEKIQRAIRDSLRSANYFFCGHLVERILRHADELMQLDLDLSIFDSMPSP